MNNKQALWASFLVVFVASVAFYIIKPALAIKLRTELRATAFEVTALTSGFMVARALAAPLVGVTGDRVPAMRSKIVRLSLFPVVLISVAYAYVPEAFLAVLLSVVHGFLSGVLWPTLQVVVGFSAPSGRRGFYLGSYFTLAGLGSSVGYGLYGSLPLNSTHLILVGALLYVFSALLAFIMFSVSQTQGTWLAHGEKRDEPSWPGFSSLTIWVLAVSFGVGGVLGLMNEYLYIFLYEARSLTKTELGYTLTVATLLSVSSGVFSGLLSDKLGIRRVLVLILLLSAAGLLLLGLSTGKLCIIFSLAAVLLASKATLPLTRNISVAGTAAMAGTVIGVSNTLSNVGSAIFPLSAGCIYDILGGETIFGVDGRALPLVLASLAMFLLALLSPLAKEKHIKHRDNHSNH
ncbi:MAG: hypothetical protein DRO11_04045 [Methanobacteriota archaeon]|nr:MAG: hypothetical protein DRO11_04045 [Euryarchaeota archaeon]